MKSINIKLTTIIMCVIIIASACSNKDKKTQQPPAPTPVSVSEVKEELVITSDSYPGVVTALNEVELRAEVGGYITVIYIKDGQKVTKGQKLYEINRTKYLAAVRSAEANVQVAKSNYNKFKKDAERYTSLARQEAVAKQKVDYALTDLENAGSQVAVAQAELINAQTDLRRSIILSPLSGTIGISKVKVGALITTGTTILNTVSVNDPISIDIDVNQRDISRFTKLKNTSTRLADSLFSIKLQNNTIYPSGARIITIDRAVDPTTGTLKVRISFSNKNSAFIPGMLCSMNILNRSQNKLLTIPYKAVIEQLGENMVYIVGDSSKAQQKIIKLGAVIGQKVVVTEGLKAGEPVIYEGIQNLRPGSEVKPGENKFPATKE